MKLADERFGIDLETGGFEPRKHAILGIGCWWGMRENGRPRLEVFRVLVQRQIGTIVETAAAEKNGWRGDEDWEDRGAVPLRVAIFQLLEWVGGLQRKLGGARLVPVAHNVFHDRQFLEHGLMHCGGGSHPLERWHEHVSKHWRCSMLTLGAAMDAGMVPDGSHSLDRLIDLMGGKRREGFHDPREDAAHAVQGYDWLLRRMQEFRGGQLPAENCEEGGVD